VGLSEYFNYFLIWYSIGFVLSSIVFALKKGEILIGDIPTLFALALGGPVWLVILLLDGLSTFFTKYEEVPLWQSKKRRAESILFNKKRDDLDLMK